MFQLEIHLTNLDMTKGWNELIFKKTLRTSMSSFPSFRYVCNHYSKGAIIRIPWINRCIWSPPSFFVMAISVRRYWQLRSCAFNTMPSIVFFVFHFSPQYVTWRKKVTDETKWRIGAFDLFSNWGKVTNNKTMHMCGLRNLLNQSTVRMFTIRRSKIWFGWNIFDWICLILVIIIHWVLFVCKTGGWVVHFTSSCFRKFPRNYHCALIERGHNSETLIAFLSNNDGVD